MSYRITPAVFYIRAVNQPLDEKDIEQIETMLEDHFERVVLLILDEEANHGLR